jgi:uncharacterized membrane protein
LDRRGYLPNRRFCHVMGAAELTGGEGVKMNLGIGGLVLLFVNILAVSFFIVAFVAMIVFIVRNVGKKERNYRQQLEEKLDRIIELLEKERLGK